MNIVVAGEQPFKVLERFEGRDFPAGEIEPIDSGTSRATTRRRPPIRARHSPSCRERVSGEQPDAGELEAEDSYGIAARVELPPETKQALLELRSEPERLRMLGGALRALIAAVAGSREIAERAKMNGKVIVG